MIVELNLRSQYHVSMVRRVAEQTTGVEYPVLLQCVHVMFIVNFVCLLWSLIYKFLYCNRVEMWWCHNESTWDARLEISLPHVCHVYCFNETVRLMFCDPGFPKKKKTESIPLCDRNIKCGPGLGNIGLVISFMHFGLSIWFSTNIYM